MVVRLMSTTQTLFSWIAPLERRAAARSRRGGPGGARVVGGRRRPGRGERPGGQRRPAAGLLPGRIRPWFAGLVWALLGGAALAGLSGAAGLLLGAVAGTVLGTPRWAAPLGGTLLRAGIVASGARLPLTAVAAAGAEGFVGSAAVLAAVGVLAAFGWRRLRVDGEVATLVAAGTAICGGSAIAAAAPAIGARASAVGAALAVVFCLNGLALFVAPLLGAGLSDEAYAHFCALGIHDTSSVVGAAALRGDGVLATAVALKLARSLWILPVVAGLAWWVARRVPAGQASGRARAPRPWFIGGFVLVSALVTWIPVLAPAGAVAADLGARAMGVALVCVGASLTPEALRRMGLRPLLLGVLLWAAVLPLARALAAA